MPRWRCHVSGKVQGVFYRDGTREEARRLGVRGWVRNLEDGRVEAVLEGEEAALRAMVAWMERGPPAARVESVHWRDEPEEGLRDFEVRRSGRA